jgi:hypothetical protein
MRRLPGPHNAYRNGTMYASYTAASFARIWDLAQQRQINLDGVLSWAFEFEDQSWFAGYRQLSTNGVNLPVLNVFRLFGSSAPNASWPAVTRRSHSIRSWRTAFVVRRTSVHSPHEDRTERSPSVSGDS